MAALDLTQPLDAAVAAELACLARFATQVRTPPYWIVRAPLESPLHFKGPTY